MTSDQRPVRVLAVRFDTPIDPWELPAFRGAIARKAGWEHTHYHNHRTNDDGGGFHYRLPLIQYKQEHGTPILLCLNEGIESLHHFFSQPDWSLQLNGQARAVRIQRLDVREHPMHVGARTHRYHLRRWIALNEDNYAVYTRLGSLLEKLFLLQQILRNQIVGLLDQLDCHPEQRLEVHVQQLQEERWVTYKGVKLLAFSLEFSANVALPDYLGLGKGASVGWGIIKGLKK